jgi:hypothetical protein
MGREIYVYYTVAPQAQHDARREIDAMQHGLRASVRGLSTQLLRRADDTADGAQTWMEIYRRDGGVDAALQAQIAQRAQRLCTPGLGERHVEVFETLSGPAQALHEDAR